MHNNIPLFEYLALNMRLEYISDLRFLSKKQKQIMKEFIKESVPAHAGTLFEWNDALAYITDRGPCINSETARKKLIASL